MESLLMTNLQLLVQGKSLNSFCKRLACTMVFLPYCYTFALTQTPHGIVRDTTALSKAITTAWALRTSDLEQSFLEGRQLLQSATALQYPKGIAQSLNIIGNYYIAKSQYDSAAAYLYPSLHLRIAMKNPSMVANSLNMLAIMEKKKGQHIKALNLNQRQIAILVTLDDKREATKAMGMRSSLYKAMGLADSAFYFQMIAERIAENSADMHSISQSLLNFGANLQSLHDSRAAMDRYIAALIRQIPQNDVIGQAKSWNNIGAAMLNMEKFDSAAISFTHAIALKEKLGTTEGLAGTYLNLSLAEQQRGRLSQAQQAINMSFEILSTSDNYAERARAYMARGNLSMAMDRPLPAIKDFIAADSIAANTDEAVLKIECKQHLAIGYAYAGRYQDAYQLLSQYQAAQHELERQIGRARERSIQYEAGKREMAQQIQMLVAQNKSQRMQLLLVIAFAILVILSAIIAFLLFLQRKRKMIAKQALEIQEQEFSAKLMELDINSLYSQMESVEATRKAIAQNLHDNLKNLLSMAKVYLTAIKVPDPSIAAKLTEAESILDNAIQTVRNIASEMGAPSIIDIGLDQAIRKLGEEIQRSTSLEVYMVVPEITVSLSRKFRTNVYTVVQELVANVITHAHATELALQLYYRHGNLHISVEDNGIGFYPLRINPGGGNGLKNVKNRVKFLGGEILFDSGRGGGTTIHIDLPVGNIAIETNELHPNSVNKNQESI
jgi:two-component system, NarL family, sensor kinase